MSNITADYKNYNANTRGKDVGDCVKRSLSLAFGMDYDEVSKELNRIKRDLGATQYNSDRVFQRFLKDRGFGFARMPEPLPTVAEFCESHPTGTWLCLTGRRKRDIQGGGSHMLCIIDGDVYDSWNSLKDQVVYLLQVKGDVTEFPTFDMKYILYDVSTRLIEYCAQLETKYAAYLSMIQLASYSDSYYQYQNDTTGVIRVKVKVAKDFKYAQYDTRYAYGHEIVLKANLQKSEEENIDILYKKCKQKIYDWVYNIQKDLKDAEKAESANLRNAGYMRPSTKKLAMSLPEWIHPYIYDLYYDEWDNAYSLSIVRPEEDPDSKRNQTKYFREGSLRELKNAIAEYQEEIHEYYNKEE